MALITDREEAAAITDACIKQGVSIAVFCTGSYWNTEAILIAAQNVADQYGIRNIPVVVSMTMNYAHMQQARRFTRSGHLVTGFLSNIQYMKELCAKKDSPYGNVLVIPHLDHADPARDNWALTKALPYLASVMFDAQKYDYEENIRLTGEYVSRYGKKVLVEGIMEEIKVERDEEKHRSGLSKREVVNSGNYIEKAVRYVRQTGVDFLVADLGTEQQTSHVGGNIYYKKRAIELTSALGRSMLTLHGTSCLNENQLKELSSDGIVRVNMWTRIVREAGCYAADRLVERLPKIHKGDFEAAESRQYIFDNIDKAADIMQHLMELFGYGKLC
jgi:fructose/tagatose bisphosphate aldolase